MSIVRYSIVHCRDGRIGICFPNPITFMEFLNECSVGERFFVKTWFEDMLIKQQTPFWSDATHRLFVSYDNIKNGDLSLCPVFFEILRVEDILECVISTSEFALSSSPTPAVVADKLGFTYESISAFKNDLKTLNQSRFGSTRKIVTKRISSGQILFVPIDNFLGNSIEFSIVSQDEVSYLCTAETFTSSTTSLIEGHVIHNDEEISTSDTVDASSSSTTTPISLNLRVTTIASRRISTLRSSTKASVGSSLTGRRRSRKNESLNTDSLTSTTMIANSDNERISDITTISSPLPSSNRRSKRTSVSSCDPGSITITAVNESDDRDDTSLLTSKRSRVSGDAVALIAVQQSEVALRSSSPSKGSGEKKKQKGAVQILGFNAKASRRLKSRMTGGNSRIKKSPILASSSCSSSSSSLNAISSGLKSTSETENSRSLDRISSPIQGSEVDDEALDDTNDEVTMYRTTSTGKSARFDPSDPSCEAFQRLTMSDSSKYSPMSDAKGESTDRQGRTRRSKKGEIDLNLDTVPMISLRSARTKKHDASAVDPTSQSITSSGKKSRSSNSVPKKKRGVSNIEEYQDNDCTRDQHSESQAEMDADVVDLGTRRSSRNKRAGSSTSATSPHRLTRSSGDSSSSSSSSSSGIDSAVDVLSSHSKRNGSSHKMPKTLCESIDKLHDTFIVHNSSSSSSSSSPPPPPPSSSMTRSSKRINNKIESEMLCGSNSSCSDGNRSSRNRIIEVSSTPKRQVSTRSRSYTGDKDIRCTLSDADDIMVPSSIQSLSSRASKKRTPTGSSASNK